MNEVVPDKPPTPSSEAVTSSPAPTPAAPVADNDAANRVHHKHSPSKLAYLDECAAFTGSSGTNPAAEEGTFLHGIMDNLIKRVTKDGGFTAAYLAREISDKEVTDEQVEYLRFACKRVDFYLAGKPVRIHSEIKVRTKRTDGRELNSGYLDVFFVYANRTGVLLDFKFGWNPVKPASDNLQGFNYAVGCFRLFQDVDTIGIEFTQPKLNFVSTAVVQRNQVAELTRRMQAIVERAEYVIAHPEEAHKFMRAGSYCDYCARAGVCTALANMQAAAASKYAMIPMPPAMTGLELTKPEDLALARYWIEIIEKGFDGLKAKAQEVAEANGGRISCTLPDGREVAYEIQERGSPRVLGDAIEVASALEPMGIMPQEILGAADLAVTKLEAVCKDALVSIARAEGRKLTKKAAWEQVESVLIANGVLSQSDVRIRFLKQVKEHKQIENTQ